MILTSLILLMGCEGRSSQNNHVVNQESVTVTPYNKRFIETKINNIATLMIDSERQVQYLKVQAKGIEGSEGAIRITPIIDSNGELYKSLEIGEISTRFTYEELSKKEFLLTDNNTNVEYLIVFSKKTQTDAVEILHLR